MRRGDDLSLLPVVDVGKDVAAGAEVEADLRSPV